MRTNRDYIWFLSVRVFYLFLIHWQFAPIIVEGAQKLRPWLGNPSWITGTNPPSRFLNGFVNFKQSLYLYGGAISISGMVDLSFFLGCIRYSQAIESSAEALGDLHHFDTASSTWTDLTNQVQGHAPGPRFAHGFTSTGDDIYVFGGATDWSVDAPKSGDHKYYYCELKITLTLTSC